MQTSTGLVFVGRSSPDSLGRHILIEPLQALFYLYSMEHFAIFNPARIMMTVQLYIYCILPFIVQCVYIPYIYIYIYIYVYNHIYIFIHTYINICNVNSVCVTSQLEDHDLRISSTLLGQAISACRHLSGSWSLDICGIGSEIRFGIPSGNLSSKNEVHQVG